MITADQVRALAMALPCVEDGSTAERLAFAVSGKGFAWTWLERTAPKGPRVPRLEVLAVRCRPEAKDLILESDPDVCFIDDHYRGFPAVLVRLARIAPADLEALLAAGWRCQAPKALLRAFDTADR